MSKKAKIKKLKAENGKMAHEYKISEMARRMLIDDRRKFEHDLLMAKNEIDKLADDLNVSDSYAAYLQAQVDELQESLGESQAGRAELQRQIDTDGSKLIAAIWREHAKETAVYADELRAELETVTAERDSYGKSIDNWSAEYYQMEEGSVRLMENYNRLGAENTDLRAELDAVKKERDYLEEVLGTIVSLAI